MASTVVSTSGTSTPSAPPAMAAYTAIQPALRPITSTTITRSCDWAVECRRSSASVTTCTAVSNPKVRSVPTMSLSIVLGTPTTGSPSRACTSRVISIVCSPPMAITASTSPRSIASRTRSGPSSWRNGS